jgi:cytochrome P450
MYEDNVLRITNELRGLMIAGADTTAITSANFIYYMTAHQEYKEKLLAEVTPVLDKV